MYLNGFVLTSSVDILNDIVWEYFSTEMACKLMRRLNKNSLPHSNFFRAIINYIVAACHKKVIRTIRSK